MVAAFQKGGNPKLLWTVAGVAELPNIFTYPTYTRESEKQQMTKCIQLSPIASIEQENGNPATSATLQSKFRLPMLKKAATKRQPPTMVRQ